MKLANTDEENLHIFLGLIRKIFFVMIVLWFGFQKMIGTLNPYSGPVLDGNRIIDNKYKCQSFSI